MDRRVAIVAYDALRNQDRVLVVEAVPRHERDQHVLAERELAQIGRRAVGDHVADGDVVADLDDRALVDVRVLVRARVLRQVVDIDAHLTGHRLIVVDANDDPPGVNVVDDTAAQRLDGSARVDRNGPLDAGPDQRLFSAQARHRLALHVRAHQCAVRIVVLQERNQRRGDRHDLRRRNVHVLDTLRRRDDRLVLAAARHEIADQRAMLVELAVRLRDHVLAFLDRRQVVDVVGDLMVDHLAIRRFEEAEFVRPRVQRKRIDQTDVRAFRRLDRADAAVVRRMHVTHLEARTLAGQAAGTQRRYAPLVRDLGQRIRLVHELRQLGRAEEFLDRGADRLCIDQVVRHQVFALGLAETLLDRPLDADEAGAELILGQLADRAYATVAEVVDVVDLAAAVAQFDQDLDDGENVVGRQCAEARQLGAADPTVELHPADLRQVVRFLVEEQPME